MRSTRLLPLLAAALVAAPLASASTGLGAAAAHPSSAVVQQAGTAAASVTQRAHGAPARRTARPAPRTARRTVEPVARPATKPVTRPVTRPVTKPVAPPAAAPVGPVAPVAAPAAAAASSAFAFLHVDAGAPVRWNPCADVPWTFNPAGAPAGGLAAVQAAIDEVGRRTGLTFAYLGTVDDTPTAAYLTQEWRQFRPLLVGWTSAAASDLLAGRTASTVGMTRVLWTGSFDDAGANHTQIASAVVALNTATKAATTGPGSWYAYALHELGHAVGLSHVDDATQVMNPVIAHTTVGYGAGDLAGLAAVGKDGGCLPSLR